MVTHYPDPTPRGIRVPGCGQAGDIFADNIDNAVVRDICLENNLSLPHEIGHLQGARHNPEEDSNNNPFAYQHGYFVAAERQRTVMSYNNAACVTPTNPLGCIRMGVWSDPNDTFFGSVTPAGTENSHFNAKVLYGSAQYISSLRGEVQRYDDQSPTGLFNWVGLQVDRIFNQGDTMDIRATFDEPIHENHPPTVTISDGTLVTPIVMDRTSSTAFTASHDFTTEEGTVTLKFSNAQDLFTNPVTLTATGNSGSVTVNTPDTVPGIPTSLQTILGNAQVFLSWSAPSDDGGDPITDYLIEYKLSSEPTNWSTFAHGNTSVTETITGLTNDSSYDFRVSATNTIGTGDVSFIVTTTPDGTAPTAGITYSESGPYTTIGNTITITATFSEPVKDSPIPQISISGSNIVSPTNMIKTSNTIYTYLHTITAGDGTATVSLSEAQDLVGNPVIITPTSGATFIINANHTPQFVKSWGTQGTGNEEFHKPNNITTNATHIFVTESFNHRIKIFVKCRSYNYTFFFCNTDSFMAIN